VLIKFAFVPLAVLDVDLDVVVVNDAFGGKHAR
jgi:hypothetical protein